MSYQYNGLIQFVAAEQGDWNIISMSTLSGEALAPAKTMSMAVDNQQLLVAPQWILKGFRSNVRYTHKTEKAELDQQSTPLGQSANNCAALIPIQKSPEWWNMAQDERRKIFEDDSQHIATSMKYLSAISRQLHHSRDIGEPFDFLTWFEFAEKDAHLFDELCYTLRKTTEWQYVIREVDIRLMKA